MKKISIPYFPTGIKYATPLLLGLGIFLWTLGYPLWTGILALLIMIILTTNYVTEIDLDKKEYRDFLSFLWIPFEEERVKFKTVDKIVITKDNHSQMLNSRSRSRQLDWSSFTGTLIVDNNKTLDLLTRTDKKELVKGLMEFVDFLKVEVEDQTTNRHFMIDISKY
jgi:hypothetical protein